MALDLTLTIATLGTVLGVAVSVIAFVRWRRSA